jgi:hypothetical protein
MTPYDPEFCVPLKTGKAAYRPRIDRRSFSLLVFLLTDWLGLTWGTDLFWLTLTGLGLMFSGVLVIALALIPSAIGFGLFALGGRFIAFCRRKDRWTGDKEGRRWGSLDE